MSDYNYATFDQYGRATVIRSGVQLDLPHQVAHGTKPEDIYHDGESIVQRQHITLTVDREYFINDGIDSPIITGLPNDGHLIVNNVIDGLITSDVATAMIIEAVGKYRSNPISVMFEPLEQIAERFIKQVDEAAGVARARYMTTIPGQQMVYSAKEAEARLYLTDSAHGNFIYLMSEAGSADGMQALAEQIVQRADECRSALASIEALRIGAKQAISSATDAATILAAADITWP